jgi:deoxyribodipyrimidine photo-lyase
MHSTRRTRANFALQRAAQLARELDRPLLVFEPLRCAYRWASDRHHRFALDGMQDNADELRGRALHYAYVEPEAGAGRGLLRALAQHACALVTDWNPSFFLPRAVAAARAQCALRFEEVDSNGLLPIAAAPAAHARAYDFRRFLQRELAPHLATGPLEDALAGPTLAQLARVPAEIESRWPAACAPLLAGDARELARLPIDHSVAVVARPGGARAARAALAGVLECRLARYAEERSEPSSEAASGLSSWLHWGQLGAWEVWRALAQREHWTPARLGTKVNGAKEGWWGMSAEAEAFLDELVTWRELGLNFCLHRPDHEDYESLPQWSRRELETAANDAREHVYELADFKAARTHDALWNAAQNQLLRDGLIHNYLRMLWGKKVLEWTRHPREAYAVLVELNNKYALDGRDANSYSGIGWVFGRYDRPWAPRRPVYGSIRYMSSANTARKFELDAYLERYGPGAARRAGLFDGPS